METIISFIVVLGIIVFVHELGHFLAAKWVGIRVEQFSLGYPPKMIGRKRGDTEYCIGWIPLGGYVKMSGMIDESMAGGDSLTGADDEFMSKNTGQKMLVILAGVVMNFLLAILLYTIVTASSGVIDSNNEPYLGSVLPGSVAEEAGLQADDKIISIGGSEVANWTDLVALIHPHPDEALTFVYERDGIENSVEITPAIGSAVADWEIQKVGMVGISPKIFRRDATTREVLTSGWYGLLGVMEQVAQSLYFLVSGQATYKDLGGPVMIAKLSGDAASMGIVAFLSFIAFISVNIGCLNLLPIPALDGGHFVIIGIEGLIRRELPVKAKLIVQQVGMFLLMGLIILIIWNDIQRVFGFDWLKNIF
jgi:regulator of sigma E protease